MPKIEEPSADLECHRCRYDLRAHPGDGKCPECGESVAESQRLARIPRRPAWRDSDPRWRRRMLVGVWMLVFLPLMDFLNAFDLLSIVPFPRALNFFGTINTLEDSLVGYMHIYPQATFCIGIVCLFSKERGRRDTPLDRTRSWGVFFSYIVFLLCLVQVLAILALVSVALAAILMSSALKYQPAITSFLTSTSTAYLRYGPFPKDIAGPVTTGFSSILVLLGCAPLFNALRSCGRRWAAFTVLSPLCIFSLIQLVTASVYCFALTPLRLNQIYRYHFFFDTRLLAISVAELPRSPDSALFLVETAKWGSVFAIAIWLSIAQFLAWRNRKRPRMEQPAAQTNLLTTPPNQ